MKDSPIIIQIDPSMEQAFERLGISNQEKTEKINEIQKKCMDIYEISVKNLNIQCDKTKKEIEQLQQKHRQAMAAYGIQETEINQNFKPIKENNLLEQLSTAKNEYELFRIKISEQIKKIENFVLICRDAFDALEVPEDERGEFADVGESDFTRERIERFRSKVEELQKKINSRKNQVESSKERIQNVIKNMSDYNDEVLNNLFNKDEVGNTYIVALNECEERANKEFETRLQQLKDYAIDITNSWDTLNTPDEERDEFVHLFSDLSLVTLEACKQKIAELRERENQMLPTLIEGKREELANLYALLHISIESRTQFDKSLYEEKDLLHEEYTFISEEIIRLKKLIETYHPILVEIDKRESIIADYNLVLKNQKDPNRLTSRGRGMAQQLLKEEKARKRYKNVLPQVEKNLEQLLNDYFNENNKHFEWDGKPYIEKLFINKKKEKVVNKEKRIKSAKTKEVPLHPSQNYNPNAKCKSCRK